MRRCTPPGEGDNRNNSIGKDVGQDGLQHRDEMPYGCMYLRCNQITYRRVDPVNLIVFVLNSSFDAAEAAIMFDCSGNNVQNFDVVVC
jgi:hypothetical protein